MDYKEVCTILDQAREAILAQDIDRVTHCLSGAVEFVEHSDLTAQEAESLKNKLDHLHNLVEAASSGLSAARETLSSVLTEVRSSLTYDRDGRACRVAGGVLRARLY